MIGNPTRSRSLRRRRQRGAVFVEAVIVIASFVLFLLGLVFFRDLYLKKLQLARLARASALAYSMGGCTDNDPSGWAKADLGAKNTAGAGRADQLQPTKEPRGVTGSPQAENIVRGLPGTGTDDSILNPIGNVTLGGRVSTEARRATPLRPGLGFARDLRWSSHVTCGDKVRDGDFGEIVGVVTSQFKK